MDDTWEIRTEQRTVARLYRNGAPILNADGRPAEYRSVAEAQYVAETWEEWRAPTLAELHAMSETELLARSERVFSREAGSRSES